MADSFLRKVTSLFSRKYNANWFVNFLKVAADEDAKAGRGIDEPLRSHAWLATAVDYRADNLARATFRLYRGDTEVETGPTYNLFRDVNPQMSRRQLFRATEAWLAYKGEAFWLFDFADRVPLGSHPREIYVIDPRKMKHVIERNRIVSWVYEDGDERIPFSPKDLIHFAYWNPYDLYRGISRIASLGYEISMDVEGNRSNLAMLRNGSIPAGVLSTEQYISPEEAQGIVERWEAKYQGASKAHRIAALGQGTTYQPIQMTPRDMEYEVLRRWDRQTILARLGTPGVLLGATDDRSPLSGSDTKIHQRNFWETALMPDIDLITDKLRTEFFSRFKLDYKGEFDVSEIPELHEETDAVHTRMATAVSSGLLTINEAREQLGYDPVPGGDDLYLPMMLSKVGADTVAPEKRVEVSASFESLLTKSGYSEDFKEKHWKSVIDGWEKLERDYQRDLKEWMFHQRSVLLDTLFEKKEVGNDDYDRLMDEGFWRTEGAKLREFSREHFRKGAVVAQGQIATLWQQIGRPLSTSWSIFDTNAVKLIDTRLTKIGGVVDTIRNHLGDSIGRGIAEGLGVEQTAEIIREQYGYNASRAATIARTEIGNVIEDSRNAAFENLGVKMTVWVSARDGKVRPGHRDEDNPEPVPMGEVFPGSQVRYPNDPMGSADMVINCRCITLPALEDE